jgi:hypothetical protein
LSLSALTNGGTCGRRSQGVVAPIADRDRVDRREANHLVLVRDGVDGRGGDERRRDRAACAVVERTDVLERLLGDERARRVRCRAR